MGLKVEKNNEVIRKYNVKVNEFKVLMRQFREAEQIFIEEDQARMDIENLADPGTAKPQGRLNNGRIPPVPEASQSPVYQAYVDKFAEAQAFFDANLVDIKKPE